MTSCTRADLGPQTLEKRRPQAPALAASPPVRRTSLAEFRDGDRGCAMCSGGRLLADFTAGTETPPDVPDVVRACLTETADGRWVVWAQKLARLTGEAYQPLTGGATYPADAAARCRQGSDHEPPQPNCTCGFHALSAPPAHPASGSGVEVLLSVLSPGFGSPMRMSRSPQASGMTALEVMLSGRVLALEWRSGGVLFRAARQTVVRVLHDPPTKLEPDDPGGVLAHLGARHPKGEGPRRLRLPSGTPPAVDVADDAGFCVARQVLQPEVRTAVPASC